MARIYVADDDGSIRSLVTLCLVEEGHEVLAAKDGESILQSVVEEPPDVLVLDILMPRLNGYEVLEALDTYGLTGMTKVLILTAKGAESDRVEGLKRGADGYLAKPFEPAELLSAVTHLLDSSNEDLLSERDEELRKASLLARLESVFDGPGDVETQ